MGNMGGSRRWKADTYVRKCFLLLLPSCPIPPSLFLKRLHIYCFYKNVTELQKLERNKHSSKILLSKSSLCQHLLNINLDLCPMNINMSGSDRGERRNFRKIASYNAYYL